MRILVDADFLIALAKADDSNHKKAISLAEKLKGNFFFSTQFTVPESSTVFSYKVSQKDATKFLLQVRKMDLIELPFDKKLSDLTDELFVSVKTKGTSWIDCLNVVSVKSYNLDGILSFDKFYKKHIKVF
jgi:predicted nucleic acid-binding protein